MRPGARTPEELETLLEDAFLLHSVEAVTSLFRPDGLMAVERDGTITRSGDPASILAELDAGEPDFVAQPRRVLQAGNTALVVSTDSINVLTRSEGRWRYAIALLSGNHETTTEATP